MFRLRLLHMWQGQALQHALPSQLASGPMYGHVLPANRHVAPAAAAPTPASLPRPLPQITEDYYIGAWPSEQKLVPTVRGFGGRAA